MVYPSVLLKPLNAWRSPYAANALSRTRPVKSIPHARLRAPSASDAILRHSEAVRVSLELAVVILRALPFGPEGSESRKPARTHTRDGFRRRGHRASTVVVNPPRGVNSPVTVHHTGLVAATMSRKIRFTAFS